MFECWQSSLIQYLASRDESRKPQKLNLKDEDEFPRVVMAPNAAAHYENLQLERAIAESQKSSEVAKKRQILVVKSHSADRISSNNKDDTDEEIDLYRKKRDQLYRKAMEANSRKIGGVAAYYAAEAR